MKTQLQALPSLLATSDLALEVRAEDATLLTRGTASHVAEVVESLQEGSYVLTCTDPIGTQVSGLIQLSQDGQVEIPDSLATELGSRRESHRGGGASILASAAAPTMQDKPDVAFYSILGTSSPDLLESMGVEPVGGVVERPRKGREIFWRALCGTAPNLSEIHTDALCLHVSTDKAEVRNESNVAITLQFLDVGEPAFNIVVPPAASIALTASARQGRPSVAAHLNVPLADDLLAVRQSGRLLELTAMAVSVGPKSIIDIAANNESAAIAVAFAVLRAGRMEVVIEALRELRAERSANSDLLILQGEVAARDGRYDAAKAAFDSASSVHSQCLASPLATSWTACASFAMTRPERQAEVIDQNDLSVSRRLAPLEPAIQRIQAFSSRCSFGVPLTNYTGLNPLSAGDELVTEADVLNSQAQRLITFPTSP